MPSNKFFNEQEEQSRVKAEIVSRYFWAWASVIIPSAKKHAGKIAYLDLFAGPGRYLDGAKSTPVLILEQAIQDENMRRMLVTMFNDRDSNNVQSLQNEIAKIDGVDKLANAPIVINVEVDEDMVHQFESIRLIPTLFFVDPWGYKGLSLRLVNSVLKNWGCDCIFFFNYNRINMGLSNDAVREHMNALFGENADRLRERLEPMSSEEREITIVEELARSLKDMGGEYVLPFRFKDARGSRTSHHLIFVSKHFRGYEIMRDIMAKQSSSQEQGVSSFEYNQATERQPLLLSFLRPLDDLGDMLLTAFSGRTLMMKEIYENHSVDRPFIKKNYKECLKQLEAQNKITVNPPFAKRKKVKGEVTFADEVSVTFR